MTWALLDSAPANALDNMATDLALLRRAARSGRAVLRLYAWERPTVSFGRHEAVRGVWDINAMSAAGLDVVRRPTGGRALLHSHDVTYSVTMPLAEGVAWREVYDAVNAHLVSALQSLGAPARLSARRSALSPNGALCFTAPSEGEIMFGNEKIAGSAVWRADGGYLQHGSILLHNAQHSLERFRVAARTEDPPDGREPLQAWSDAETVAQSIRDVWRAQARDICTFEPSPEYNAVLTHARHELAAPNWLWRR